MDTPVSTAPALRAPERSLETLISDLAQVLASGRAVYFSLEPQGAVLSVKSPEVFAFGESVGSKWASMRPHARAEAVVDWIRRAAEYCRDPKVRQCLPREMAV